MSEKSLNDLPRDLRVLFSRGSDALQRDNFDYAIEMFTEVLNREPGLHECRRALRTAQLKKVGTRGGFMKKMWNLSSSSPMVVKGQMTVRKDPVQALQIAEEILGQDPTNSQAHRLIVEAATALEMPHTAVLSLEILHRGAPKDKDISIKFATALADVGEVARAEKMLGEVCDAHPTDMDLAQALKNISARKTLDEGGYDALSDGSGSYRDILKNEAEAKSLEQQNRVQKTEDTTERLIKEYEARLTTEPNNLKLIRSLAELYTQKKRFDAALRYYDRLKASDLGNDPSLDRGIADTIVRRFDHQISQLDQNAADYADSLAHLQSEKQAYQLAECQKRVSHFPTDLQLRYELGQQFFQAGKISEAIQEFQKSQANPHRRIGSMNYLAQCYAKRKMFDLAARALQNALKEKQVFDDEKKELIYNLGIVLEAMGKKEEYIEQMKLIYEVEASYKDVSARVDKYYQGEAEGGTG
jgi:tetratricopeptide (TPR) repeat protein